MTTNGQWSAPSRTLKKASAPGLTSHVAHFPELKFSSGLLNKSYLGKSKNYDVGRDVDFP